MNASWMSLFNDNLSTDLLSGEWFTVRFIPDRVSGEVFNVGVVFIDSYEKCHYKILENTEAFRCLFGLKGSENIKFMLDVVEEMLDKNHYMITPSPHISYSNRQTARGESVDEILSDLYRSMISLICKHDEKKPKKNQTLGTSQLRQKVFSQIENSRKGMRDRIYNPEPFLINNHSNEKGMLVDMPITNSYLRDSNIRADYYGTIVSAAYLDDVHRRYNIDYVGCTNVANCCEILGKDIKAAIIIYVPPVDSVIFTEKVQINIENELDKCLQSLEKMIKNGYDINITIAHSTEECSQRVLEFAG